MLMRHLLCCIFAQRLGFALLLLLLLLFCAALYIFFFVAMNDLQYGERPERKREGEEAREQRAALSVTHMLSAFHLIYKAAFCPKIFFLLVPKSKLWRNVACPAVVVVILIIVVVAVSLFYFFFLLLL